LPTYEYECQKCGHRFEVFQSIKDTPLGRCPKCGGKVKRLISGGAGVLFKGSGFYQTDYRSESYRKRAREESGGTAKGGAEPKPASESGRKGGAKKGKDSA
jgi:putative FmdB family regulatory protein